MDEILTAEDESRKAVNVKKKTGFQIISLKAG
jgi:hypothetical protein